MGIYRSIVVNGSLKKTDGNQDLRLGSSPENQFSLRSSFDISNNIDLDFWFRYVDQLPSIGGETVADYSSLDLRLAYRPMKNLELSFNARNLIEPHSEFRPDLTIGGSYAELERNFYFQATMGF